MTHFKVNENICNALVVLNSTIDIEREKESDSKKPYMQFDKYNIIYGKDSWIVFSRQMLGNHPGETFDFLSRCQYCFSNIIFGESCRESLEYSTSQCPRQLVYCLSCINDKYQSFVASYPKKRQLNDLLAAFAGRYNFYKAGSIQGSQKGKDACQFMYNGHKLNCEGHFKIQYPDSDHTEKIHARIYFYHGDIPGEDRNLFVGSMGRHAE